MQLGADGFKADDVGNSVFILNVFNDLKENIPKSTLLFVKSNESVSHYLKRNDG